MLGPPIRQTPDGGPEFLAVTGLLIGPHDRPVLNEPTAVTHCMAIVTSGLDRVAAAVAALEADPARPVGDLAADLGISHGHLDRESTRVVELSPRTLARVLRVRRLLGQVDVRDRVGLDPDGCRARLVRPGVHRDPRHRPPRRGGPAAAHRPGPRRRAGSASTGSPLRARRRPAPGCGSPPGARTEPPRSPPSTPAGRSPCGRGAAA